MSKASVPYDEVAGDIYRKNPQLAADVLNSCLADALHLRLAFMPRSEA